ncbi:transaldolase [soil metagenome]
MEKPKPIEELHVKIFGDGAKESDILEMAQKTFIKGFTTNPSLMHEAGITDYVAFAKEVLSKVSDKPISFEVFSDDFNDMECQARIIHSWGENVYVKIPITNTAGISTAPLIQKLSAEGIKLNVTAILTTEQVATVASSLSVSTPSIVSVFAGRIADTGIDPLAVMRDSKSLLAELPCAELLWASCRETYNIYEADAVGADIITVPYNILHKLNIIGTDLTEFSLEGVRTFYKAGRDSGFTI